jgi:CubicO group peptidase (beta-lactamase class C family)
MAMKHSGRLPERFGRYRIVKLIGRAGLFPWIAGGVATVALLLSVAFLINTGTPFAHPQPGDDAETKNTPGPLPEDKDLKRSEKDGMGRTFAAPVLDPPIIVGFGAPEKLLDDLLLKYMKKIGCSAATLAVAGNGILYSRGYGWCDKEYTIPTRPQTLIGIAGCDTPLIAASIRLLASKGRLQLTEPMHKVLPIAPRGVLKDSRVQTITVQNFLDRKTGWDEGSIGQAVHEAHAQGIRDPIPFEDLFGFLLIQPLKHAPGTREEDCYFFYEVLRHVIDKRSGRRSVDFFRNELLKDFNVLQVSEIAAAGVPDDMGPTQVWNAASGGPVCASAPVLCDFMRRCFFNGERRKPGAYGVNRGSLPGSTSLMVWGKDGIDAVLLFNGRGNVAHQEIEAELATVLDRLRQNAPKGAP